jgi:hypothetical protein
LAIRLPSPVLTYARSERLVEPYLIYASETPQRLKRPPRG